jgi:hypothetical protein
MNVWALSQPPSIGWPILRVFCEGWDTRPSTDPSAILFIRRGEGWNERCVPDSFPATAPTALTNLSSRLECTRISYHALLARTTCAARPKASRMKPINSKGLHRKPGGAQWRDLRFRHPLDAFPSVKFSPRQATSCKNKTVGPQTRDNSTRSPSTSAAWPIAKARSIRSAATSSPWVCAMTSWKCRALSR